MVKKYQERFTETTGARDAHSLPRDFLWSIKTGG